jgi:hypothetical protein
MTRLQQSTIYLLLVVAGLWSQEQQVADALGQIERIRTLQCAIVRYQRIAAIKRVSRGTFVLDRERGFRYDYADGARRYCFVNVGDSLFSLNIGRKQFCGVSRNDSASFNPLYASLHILAPFLELPEHNQAWRYRGTIDSSLYASRRCSEVVGGEQYILIDGERKSVKQIELFDSAGALRYTTHIIYGKNSTSFPLAVVIRRKNMDAVIVDSLVLQRPLLNKPTPAALWVVPAHDTWSRISQAIITEPR